MVPSTIDAFSLALKELMERLAVVFGRRIRAMREAKRWTQDQLAEAAGLGSKHIGVIERGEKPSSFEAVEKLAQALGAECYELFVPHHRRAEQIQKEIDGMLRDDKRIAVENVEEFLRALRNAVRKLDPS